MFRQANQGHRCNTWHSYHKVTCDIRSAYQHSKHACTQQADDIISTSRAAITSSPPCTPALTAAPPSRMVPATLSGRSWATGRPCAPGCGCGWQTARGRHVAVANHPAGAGCG